MMRCRFCGLELKSSNTTLWSKLGPKCLGNPQGFHVAVGDGTFCVYCGNETRTSNGLLHTSHGKDCKTSPTRLHCLQ